MASLLKVSVGDMKKPEKRKSGRDYYTTEDRTMISDIERGAPCSLCTTIIQEHIKVTLTIRKYSENVDCYKIRKDVRSVVTGKKGNYFDYYIREYERLYHVGLFVENEK